MNERTLIHVYDKTLAQVATVENYEQAYFERSHYGIGMFQILINKNSPGASAFVRGRIVVFGTDTKKSGYITNVKKIFGEDGKGSQLQEVSGFDLKYLFTQRLIFPDAGDDTWSGAGPAETVMKALIEDQCGTAAAASRQYADLNILTNQARGSTFTLNTKYGTLAEALQEISESTNTGWPLVLNTATAKLDFDVVVGVDRRSSQSANARAVFSSKYDTLREGEILDSEDNYRNVCYIGGQGVGAARTLEMEYTGASEPTDLERKEMFVDARDLADETSLLSRADAKLVAYGETTIVQNAKALSYSPLALGTDYDIGDLVTLEVDDVLTDVRVSGARETWSPSKYELELEFGKPLADITRQTQQIHSEQVQGQGASESGSNVNTGDGVAGATTIPAQIVFKYLKGIFAGFNMAWSAQANLATGSLMYYEVQVSDDNTNWYSLRFDGTDWKDTLNQVTPWATELLTHNDIPFGGTVDAPTGVTLYYRVRIRTKAGVTGTWSAPATATTTTIKAGQLGVNVVYANNLVVGILNAMIAAIGEMLILDPSLGYGGQTETTPVAGSLRWFLYKYGLRGQRYDGADWQTLISIGDIVGGNFQPYVRALALIHTGVDASTLDIGTRAPTGAIAYEFENNLLPVSGTTIWSENSGLSYSAATKKFGGYALTALSSGYLRTAAAAMTLTACGFSMWAFLDAAVKGALLGGVEDGTIGVSWTERTGMGAAAWGYICGSYDGLTLYVCKLASGKLWKSADGGATWSELLAMATKDYYSGVCCSADGSYVVTFDDEGNTFYSADGGATWSAAITVNASLAIVGKACSCSADGQTVYVGSAGSTKLFKSLDGGATWSELTTSSTKRWTGLACSAAGSTVVACDSNGTIAGSVWTSADGGATWTEQAGAGSRVWKDVACNHQGTAMAAVADSITGTGYVYTSINSGASWTERTGAGDKTWSAVEISADGLKIVCANSGSVGSGYVSVSLDGGATWSEKTASGARAWSDIFMSPDGSKVALPVLGGSSYVYTSEAQAAGILWLMGTKVRFFARTATGESILDVTVAEGWHHLMLSPQDDDIFGAVDGDDFVVSDAVLSGTGRLTLYLGPLLFLDDAAVAVATEYAVADAVAHFVAGGKWALIDIDDDLYIGRPGGNIWLEADSLNFLGPLTNAAGETRLNWYPITDPTAGWLASKTSWAAADNFSSGLVVSFSGVVPVGTKAVWCRGLNTDYRSAAARPAGDTTYCSNTPFANAEQFAVIAKPYSGDVDGGEPILLILNGDLQAEITVANTAADYYVSYPNMELRE